MAATIWWGPGLLGKHGWMFPHDLCGTLVAAQRLAELDLGGLYTPPTGLISLPGAAVVLVPVAAVISAAGLTLRIPGPGNLHPGAWLPDEDRRAYFAHAAGQLPTRRIAAAEDVADAVVLAATNRNLTGTVIETDGGARLVSLS